MVKRKRRNAWAYTREGGALFLGFSSTLLFYDFFWKLYALKVTNTVIFCYINLFCLELQRELNNGRSNLMSGLQISGEKKWFQ